jgi:CubicO group peptidase (beta-lactamase class C family)
MKITFRYFLLALLLSSCDELLLEDSGKFPSSDDNMMRPPKLDDGWDVSTLEEENVDRARVQQVVQSFTNDPRKVRSLLIIRNNKLIVEAYFGGWHRKHFQSLRSATKSFNATLVGMAIDRGFIEGEDQPLLKFFPEYADLATADKNNILLAHVLSMSSGFDWNQNTGDDEDRLQYEDDALRYVLSKPMIDNPGERFLYNSGNSDLLAGVIRNATGEYADAFAAENLFEPMQISDYAWLKHNSGHINAGWGLFLTARDFAKLGQLYLDKGLWKGNRIVSEEWITKATRPVISAGNNVSYGYQWWISEHVIDDQTVVTWEAHGNGGQAVFVVPAANAVVVFTGANYGSEASGVPSRIFRNQLIQSFF